MEIQRVMNQGWRRSPVKRTSSQQEPKPDGNNGYMHQKNDYNLKPGRHIKEVFLPSDSMYKD